jgi:hypothetical protein
MIAVVIGKQKQVRVVIGSQDRSVGVNSNPTDTIVNSGRESGIIATPACTKIRRDKTPKLGCSCEGNAV